LYCGACPLSRFDAMGLEYRYLLDPKKAKEKSEYDHPSRKTPDGKPDKMTNEEVSKEYCRNHNASIDALKGEANNPRKKNFSLTVDGETTTYSNRQEFLAALDKQKATSEVLPEGRQAAERRIKEVAGNSQKGDQLILETHTTVDDINAKNPNVIGIRVGGEIVPSAQAGAELGNAFSNTKASAVVIGSCLQTQEGVQAIANVAGVKVGGSGGKTHPYASAIEGYQEQFARNVSVEIETPYARQAYKAVPQQ